MKRLPEILVAVATIAIVVFLAWKLDSNPSKPPTTQPSGPTFPAPAVGGTTLDGQRWNLQDQRGKVVLLDFWATWCPPCLRAIPEIKTVYEKFKGHSDFVLVGVSQDDSKSTLKSFVERKGLGWLQVYDPANRNEMARAFRVDGIPATFLIDREGNYRRVELGPEDLIAEIERLLKPQAPSLKPSPEP